MSKLLSVAVLGLALSFGAAHAQDAKKPTAQQSKMGVCNKEAGEKKGDERKAFMSDCLKNKPVATTQQDKMKVCNTSAKDKKGDERKAFMSECLKKKA